MNLSSPFRARQATLSPKVETELPPSDPLTPSPASVYYTPPPTPRKPSQCWLCLQLHMGMPARPAGRAKPSHTDKEVEFLSRATGTSTMVTAKARDSALCDGHSYG